MQSFRLFGAGALAAALAVGAPAMATPSPVNGVCPAGVGGLGSATDCNVKLFVGNGPSYTTIVPNPAPYDGSDDNLVGVINNSSASMAELAFPTHGLNGYDLFGFDGDGIQTFAAGIGNDPTGYGGMTSLGEDTSFTDYGGSTGTVVFGASGIPVGGTAYFSLEGPPSGSLTPVGVPEPGTLALLGTGILALLLLGRRHKPF